MDFEFPLDSFDDGFGRGDDGEHFLVGCFEMAHKFRGLRVHAVLKAVQSRREISEQNSNGSEADDEEGHEEPAVALTGGEIGDLEELFFHSYKKSALVMS